MGSSEYFVFPSDEEEEIFIHEFADFLHTMEQYLDTMESEEVGPHKQDSPEQRSFKVSEQVHEERNDVDIREEQTIYCPRAAFLGEPETQQAAHNQGVSDGRGVSPAVDLQSNQDKCMESEVLEGGDDEFREEFSCFLSKLRDHLDFTNSQHISHDLQENQPLEIMTEQIVEKFHIDAEEEVDVQCAEVDADEEPKEEDREDQKDIVPHELATVNEVQIVPEDISQLTNTVSTSNVPEFKQLREDDTEYVVTFMHGPSRDPKTEMQRLEAFTKQMKETRIAKKKEKKHSRRKH